MSALKPCPFCGEVPFDKPEYFDTRYGTKWGFVFCGCGCSGPEIRTGYGKLKEWKQDAIDAWNERKAANEKSTGTP